MDIKRKKKEKRIQLFGGLIGVCVAVASLFYFFHAEKAEAEKRMVEIVNYVKVQCSTYTHFNESSESKSLLRAIESARQMSTNIKMEIENGGQLSRDFLKENLQTLWVDGIIVLDAEGKTDCEYSTDESLANEITEYLQKEIIMNFAGYEERSYSERFTREDGSFIDIAACARKDALGIVAIYYYTSPEFARNYTLTIQGLLNGYSIQKDGTIIVADDGIVVASNDESLLGQNTADNEVVQAMKKHTDSQHIYHLRKKGIGCYGIMLKQHDYYIYAYLPDTEVFHNLPLSVASVIFLYFLSCLRKLLSFFLCFFCCLRIFFFFPIDLFCCLVKHHIFCHFVKDTIMIPRYLDIKTANTVIRAVLTRCFTACIISPVWIYCNLTLLYRIMNLF